MTPDVEVRIMEPAERAQVKALELEPDQHPYVPPMDQVLSRALRKADVREFVILRGLEVVGYFQLNLSAGETAHYCGDDGVCGLEAMMIERRLQGRGIGHQALLRLPTLAAQHAPGFHQVNLTVNFSNRPAQKLYRRCGFEDTGLVYAGASSGPQHIYALRFAVAPVVRARRRRGRPWA